MARLSIGEFARASGLTPKALRLYDELALLPPAHVDPRSGYRSYERRQLDRARLVAGLRALGMPLARIRVVCDLAPHAAAAEVLTYWRQVEADTAARGELAALLVDQLSGKDNNMTGNEALIRPHAVARTDRGLVRESNQDEAYAGSWLFAVADGFGDDAASTAAITALRRADTAVPAAGLLTALGTATAGARSAVHTVAATLPAGQDAGTTLTAMLWSGGQFALAHVGDSRAYRLREGALTRITHDHSWVQSLVDEGRLTPDEAAAHPQRPRLLRALHRGDEAEPDLHLREARVGDRYLLCSDGLHAVVAEDRLRDLLATAASPGAAVQDLTAAAHAEGAPDNVACVVVDALDRPATL
ncbi:MerR family transcriptional regulator [Prauserella muralis]|uniref:Uncharacterized protein n=1 Tax=Prauserella muralis TaxID=588067 RepID=A0A2V4B929_9PSEU|nr:MerR family transcriptional regulator [Prauserella muralis]PXY31925.1 hypothetical protein BAY60_06250 [Prauserella muralis]TWE13652.1 protein phosphatase [Prauserella muralis]